jgi:predicted permease
MSSIKYAFRQAARSPGLSATVIVMLALGLGATTAIFSLFHQILLRPLPVPEPERLVNFGAPGPNWGSTTCSDAGDCQHIFSYPMFRDLQAQQTVFAGIAAQRDFDTNLVQDGRTAAGRGILVSGNYFSVLGLQPTLGRLIGIQDEPRVGESAVVVLSHAYWRAQFGGDPNVVGRVLTVNGQRLTVVGVAPAGFSGTTVGLDAQVFVPITLRWLMEPTRPADHDNRRAYWVYLFARLLPDISLEQASAGVNQLYGGILNEIEAPENTAMPSELMEQFRKRQIALEPGARGQSQLPENAATPVTLLLAAAGVTLLIVCVNIANLLLARGVSRAGDIAIRASLGATPWRLVTQLLSDVAVPAAVGGLLSLPVATATLHAIAAILPEELVAGLSMELRSGALLFGGAALLATVALFSAAPAVQVTRVSPGIVAKGHAPQSVGGRGTARFRTVLATAQIAFSMVLLVLAGLFTQSLANLARVDFGMDVESVVRFTVAPRMSGHTVESALGVLGRIEDRLAAEPGVASVGSARIALLSNRDWGSRPVLAGREPLVDDRSSTNQVTAGFFEALAIPLLLGRNFQLSDTLDAPRVAIVNEAFVGRFGLGSEPLGRRFDLGARARDIEIIGIVADAKYDSVRDELPPQIFLPRDQYPDIDALTFYVRGGIDTDALHGLIRRVVTDVDPALPITDLKTMEREAQDNVFLDRLVGILCASFAALATLLAAIGLYGVLAYNVVQRTRELGLKLALGATPGRLRIAVFRQVAVMALIGGGVGVLAAVVLGRLAEGLLFGVSGHAPPVLAAAAAVLCAVVLAASYFPARRAATITPMEALRYE